MSAARPVTISRYSFEAFNITEMASAWNPSAPNRPRPYPETFENIDDAVLCGMSAGHKGKLLIVERDSFTGASTMHIYAIRKKSQGVKRYHAYETRTIHDEYAEKVVSFVWPGDAA